MRLYLARHGQTHSNVKRALDTAAPGADLTDLGRTQSRGLADRLDEHHLDGILVSHLVRTQQTAEPTASRRNLTPRIDPRIAEVAAGDWEMSTDMDVLMEYFKVAMGWMGGDYSLSTPGGESGHEVVERFNAAIDDSDEESLMVVSHGTIIQVWANIVVGNGPDKALPHFQNCGVGVFERTAGKWELLEWNHRPELKEEIKDSVE